MKKEAPEVENGNLLTTKDEKHSDDFPAASPENHLLDWFNTVANTSLGNFRFCRPDLLLDVFSILLGFSVPIPFIKSAMKFAKGNKTLEIIYAFSEESAIGFLITLLFQEILNHMRRSRLDKRPSSANYIALTLALPMVTGFFTAIPGTIVGVTYNKNAPELALFALIGEFIVNTYSIQRLSRSLYVSRRLNSSQKEFTNSLTLRLKLSADTICNWTNIEANDFLRRHNLTGQGGINYNRDQLDQLLSELIKLGSTMLTESHHGKDNKFLSKSNKFSWIVFIVAPLAWLLTSSHLTYTKLYDELGSSIAAALITAVSTFPIYLLEALFARDVFNSIVDLVQRIRHKDNIGSYGYNHNKLTFLLLQIIALLSGLFSFASRAQVTEDQFATPWKDIITPWVVTANLSMKLYAICRMISRVVDTIAKHSNKIDTSNHIKLIQLVNLLIERLKNISPNEANRLIHTDSIKQSLHSHDPMSNRYAIWEQFEPISLSLHTKPGDDLENNRTSPPKSFCSKCVIS